MVAHAGEEPFPRNGTDAERLAYLARYAVLAPSSHNSQPWRLVVGDGKVDVHADLTRWLPVADPDRRELHISIGCAIENLLVAAAHFGESYSLELFPDAGSDELIARVRLTHERAPAMTLSGLFEAIPRRRTNHHLFMPTPVPAALIERLCSACGEPGVRVHAISSEAPKAAVQEMVVAGTRKEFGDPAFRRELGEWVGRGVFGTPRALAPLARLAVAHIDMGAMMARRDAARFESAPAIVIIASASDDPAAQVTAGRVVQRFWLAAVDAGLSLQPVSQPLQVPEVRHHLRDALAIPEPWPQHLFRIGYATGEDRRRPLRDLEETLKVTGA